MNSAYIGKLMELADKDSSVLHLLADSGTGYDEMFRRNFPDQMFNFGIGEENMVAAAAGMASVGKKPFIFTAGAFLAYRSMEFIRDDICFQNLNVKIVGMGSGLSWSSLGPTHHTTEDVAVLRSIPNLMILSPATPIQVKACVQTAYEHVGPVYIKIGMNHEAEFFSEDYAHNLCRNDIVLDGTDMLVFVTGSILEETNKACEMLKGDGISVRLLNVSTLKPFNKTEVIDELKGYKNVAVVEEHNIYGGLASIIAELVAFEGLGVKVHPICLNDIFALGYGTHQSVRRINGLDAKGIYKKMKGILESE